MAKAFVSSWKAGKSPRRQRNYLKRAPLHVRHSFMRAPLEKSLVKKYRHNSIGIRTDDTVKIMRGRFKGRTGKVLRVDTAGSRVYVEGLELTRRDGTKAFPVVHASNVLIIELSLDDKKRLAAPQAGKVTA